MIPGCKCRVLTARECPPHGGQDRRDCPVHIAAWTNEARAALDRRVVDLLERLLHGEHDSAGLGPVRSRPAQAERVEKFEAECRALLAEMKETPHA